ncbi:MAG TPA: nuclear transport factor 2 family protein [Candidatus Cybelea sp.]|nr:nuclear transport factor 2 family protein [Candidatus Cybelea sp.]
MALQAFEALFNKRDYAVAERFWSPDYIQHSAHIPPGRDGLFNLVRAAAPTMRYENSKIVVNGNLVMMHGRFSGLGDVPNWIAADILLIDGDGQFAEHWDVIQDEASRDSSESGLPMFGDTFGA